LVGVYHSVFEGVVKVLRRVDGTNFIV